MSRQKEIGNRQRPQFVQRLQIVGRVAAVARQIARVSVDDPVRESAEHLPSDEARPVDAHRDLRAETAHALHVLVPVDVRGREESG